MSASEGKSTEAEGPLYDHKSPASEVYGSIHTPSEESQQGSKSQSASESESGATHKDRDPKSKNHKVTGGNDFNELKKMHNVRIGGITTDHKEGRD